MKQLRVIGSTLGLAVALSGCLDDYLTTEPPTILTDEQVWADPALIQGVIANYYGRLPDFQSFASAGGDVPTGFINYDEALYSGNSNSDAGTNGAASFGFGTAAAWQGSYGLIRDINLALESIEASSSALLTPAIKAQLNAELRFQRAYVYFDLVKRMGGVPIVTNQKIYDFGGDPTYLQQARNKESEVYDFIASELDAVASSLGNAGSVTRANRFTALALKSRAMLYAASIARHGNEGLISISTPGGEVGIPASMAEGYYQKSLEASKAIINSGQYALYTANPNPGENFWEALTKKSGNREAIWVRDYSVAGGVNHPFTMSIMPPSQRLDVFGGNQGATVAPALQLVEAFDYIDGTPGTLKGVGDGSLTGARNPASWIFYNAPQDIFANKDGRLYGTIVYPGTMVRGGAVRIQAGVATFNANGTYTLTVGSQNSTASDGGILTGTDGPIRNQSHVSTTGFYLRKFLDPAPAAGTNAVRSDIWWTRFRLGEIYLNAAEAALELGLTAEATGYVNTLRQRAGFPPNSLTTLTRDKLRNERRVELAFEDHRFWDLKRWRIAHLIMDGSTSSTTARLQGLYGYRVIGGPNAGKYVYDRLFSPRQTQPRFWRDGNYYSQIPDAVLNANPLIVKNPFH